MRTQLIIAANGLIALATQAQEMRPNIVLIMSDDLNTNIGPYMNQNKHTPNLNKLADEGITFSHAYCQYPLSGPSRASIMSGLYPVRNRIFGNQDQFGSYRAVTPSLSDHPSMAGFFREHGYFTARVSKIYHMGVPGDIENGTPGGDDPDSWDYAYNVLAPETLSPGELELLSPAHTHYGGSFSKMVLPNMYDYTQADYMAASQAIAILENRAGNIAPNATNKKKMKAEAPFFLAIGFVRPHVPLIAPERCFENYGKDGVTLPEVIIGDNVPKDALSTKNTRLFKMNIQQQKETIAAYMASINFMDEQVGRVLNALDRLGLRENTIVIFVSDHGYSLGEHDCWAKSTLWEGVARVPLIISAPKYMSTNGNINTTITELIDIYPTLTELCGYETEQPSILQGESLVKYLEDPKLRDAESNAYTITKNNKGHSVRTERYRYTAWIQPDGIRKEELYDHKNDPEEHINVINKTSYKKPLEQMRKLLAEKEFTSKQ